MKVKAKTSSQLFFFTDCTTETDLNSLRYSPPTPQDVLETKIYL